MAIAVIAGLTFATFLTLVLVPVMYSLLDDLDAVMKKYFLPQPAMAAGGLAPEPRPAQMTR